MKRLILIPLLLFCLTAFGQWTKPQLYSNINSNIRLKTYSPLRIAAVLDSIVDTMNTGAAGIGGSTGSVDNAILRADGTGGSTVQSSLWSLSDFGNLTIGTGSAITSYFIDTDGTGTNVDLRLRSKKGAGFTQFYVNGSSNSFGMTDGTELIDFVLSTNLVSVASAQALHIESQNGASTLESYTDIYVNPSVGGIGNTGFNTSSIADWKGMDKGFFEGNVTTTPSAEPTSGIFRYVGAEPEGSNMVIFNPNGYTAKPILVARGTISGGATLRGIGSTPQTLIAAPGSGKYINVISVSVSYNYGTTVYDFSGTEVPVFKYSGGSGSAFAITVTAMNSGADFNRSLGRYNINSSELGGISSPDNTGFVITTDDGGNATTGDGSLSYVIYFTIEATNN